MGAQFSDINQSNKNQYLNKLVDIEHINENDPFWNQLLAFNLKLEFNSSNSKILDENIGLLCQKFYQNNLQTLNFGSLIKVFCRRANQIKEMNDNNSVVLETKNALLIIRCFAKYLIEVDSEDVFLSHLNVKCDRNCDANGEDNHQTENSQQNDTNENILYQLIYTLIELCIHIPVEAHTYYLHLEALNTIIVLLTIQMFEKKPTHESIIFDLFMTKFDHLVSDFVKFLLNNIIQQMPNPDLNATSNNRGLLSSVASGLWSVVTLGYSSSSTSPSKPNATNTSVNAPTDSSLVENIDCQNRLLALQSCHVLLILSNHCTNELFRNPYRLALFHFTDTLDGPTSIPNLEPLPWFSIDYTKLYNVLCLTMSNDQYTLLLYMLLHRNQHFKMFILSRVNIDYLVVPILKVIYSASERNSHHIYMALIILLILSEDDLFNKSIHNIQIKKLPWYTERSITEISLGGLVVLVVIRAIQFNMTRMRDKYLHTNCLATLANMSSKFHSLHPYVCQRLNSLFNLLAKKRTKIYASINEEEADTNDGASSVDSKQDYLQDLAILEELMRMVLEIINSCLTNAIHHNGNLVYSILYNKSAFIQFQEHPSFQDIFQNIDLVIAHFSKEIENLEDKSVEKLKEVIEFGIKQFSRDRFRKFPELKFKYVEEDQPEEFFVPYVWSLLNQSSGLYWVDRSTNLFQTTS